MHFQMSNQMRLLRKPFIAILAKKRLLPRMHQHMLVKLPLGTESLPALITMVILLPRVDLRMRREITRTGEPLRAISAPVRSLRRVNRYRVFRQLLRRGESFTTRSTHMILFSCVSPHVGV